MLLVKKIYELTSKRGLSITFMPTFDEVVFRIQILDVSRGRKFEFEYSQDFSHPMGAEKHIVMLIDQALIHF